MMLEILLRSVNGIFRGFQLGEWAMQREARVIVGPCGCTSFDKVNGMRGYSLDLSDLSTQT